MAMFTSVYSFEKLPQLGIFLNADHFCEDGFLFRICGLKRSTIFQTKIFRGDKSG